MIRWALALVALLALLAPGSALAADVVDPVEYQRVVADSAALLERARDADDAQRDSLVAEARTRLEATSQVRLTDGTLIQTGNGNALEALRQIPPDLDRAIDHLRSLGAALDRQPAAGHVTTDQAWSALDDVLARPEFRRQQSMSWGPLEPLRPVFEWIDAFLTDILYTLLQLLLDALAGRASLGPLLLILVAIGAFLLVLVFVLRRFSNVVAPETSEAEQVAAGKRVRAAQVWAQALERADGGDYRGAVRLMYLATLMALDETDRLRFERTLTNREHLRQAPESLRPLLEPLVSRYDRLWYGQSGLGEREFQEFRALATRLREAAA